MKYADRFTEDLHLPVEKLAWGPSKPAIAFNPAETGFATLLDAEVRLLPTWFYRLCTTRKQWRCKGHAGLGL